MQVTDSQVHIWGPDTAQRPWPGGGRNLRHRYFTADELVQEMDAAGVARAVLVPPVFEGDRNDVALEAARRFPDRFRVVGRLALDLPQSRDVVRTWRQTPGMLGIRQSFFTPEHRRILDSGAADWFWPAAQAAGIPVYLFCPGLLPAMGDIARAHPALRLVICHFGLAPEAKLPDLHETVPQLQALAVHPNIAVMASALPCHVGEPYPFPGLKEPVQKVIAAFGADRVFWGSDLTRLPCSYREAFDFGKHLDFLAPAQREQFMGAGLMNWLRWE